MEFTQSVSYPGTVEEVVAMYLTPDYQQRRFGSFVVEGSESVAVEGEAHHVLGHCAPRAASRRRVALCQGRAAHLFHRGVDQGRGRGSFSHARDRGGRTGIRRGHVHADP